LRFFAVYLPLLLFITRIMFCSQEKAIVILAIGCGKILKCFCFVIS
jgi:hypothetical protein